MKQDEDGGTSMSTGVPRDQTGLMKPAEAAAYLNCSLRTLQKWKKDGDLVCHKLGRWVRYARADLDEFLAKTRTEVHRYPSPKRRMLRIDQPGRKA
jgi:excisionase family DNA binding protein